MNQLVLCFKWFYERLPIFSHIAFICFLFWVFYPVDESQDEKPKPTVSIEEADIMDLMLESKYENVLSASFSTQDRSSGSSQEDRSSSSNQANQDHISSSNINSVEKEVSVQSVVPQEKEVSIQSVVPQEKEVSLDAAEVEAVPVLSTDVLSQYKSIEVVATGYSPTFESTGKNPDHPEFGITYSGVRVLRDPISISTIAADLSVFPLGTVLYVPGYGYGVVSDIGSAIKGNKIDLYYDTKEHVYDQWGKKQLEVYIVEQGDGEMSEETLNELSRKYK